MLDKVYAKPAHTSKSNLKLCAMCHTEMKNQYPKLNSLSNCLLGAQMALISMSYLLSVLHGIAMYLDPIVNKRALNETIKH